MTTSSAEVPLSVIWGKETVDVTLVVANGVPSFKKELEELTGVPSDRMKLMPKSKGIFSFLSTFTFVGLYVFEFILSNHLA
jgi:hypothetical protein